MIVAVAALRRRRSVPYTVMPVSTAYLPNLRSLPATLKRLRIDCQLAEAMAIRFDPLHLAAVFGIREHAMIRYAVNARHLLGSAHQLPSVPNPHAPIGNPVATLAGAAMLMPWRAVL
jgi:hypothetical protein